MNVDGIYQLQRDDAFAAQFLAIEYQTFVAMPFNNRGGYPERRIRELVSHVHDVQTPCFRKMPSGSSVPCVALMKSPLAQSS